MPPIAPGVGSPYMPTTQTDCIGDTPMRAEHEKLVGDIKESLALLRRSL